MIRSLNKDICPIVSETIPHICVRDIRQVSLDYLEADSSYVSGHGGRYPILTYFPKSTFFLKKW